CSVCIVAAAGSDIPSSDDVFDLPALSVAHHVTGTGGQVVVVAASQDDFSDVYEMSAGYRHGFGQVQIAEFSHVFLGGGIQRVHVAAIRCHEQGLSAPQHIPLPVRQDIVHHGSH